MDKKKKIDVIKEYIKDIEEAGHKLCKIYDKYKTDYYLYFGIGLQLGFHVQDCKKEINKLRRELRKELKERK